MSLLDDDTRDFYSIPEVAQIIGVSMASVRNWIRHGKLVSFNVGGKLVRVRRIDLLRFLESGRSGVQE